MPTPNCTFTSHDFAQWQMLNAPVNVSGNIKTHVYRLRFKGRRSASDREPVTLVEREVELFPGAMTFVRLSRDAAR